jgi:hypothetical protein
MRTTFRFRFHHPFTHGLVLSLVLGLPAIADAKPASPDETVSAAKSSKLYKRQLRRADITKTGLKTIAVSPGVDMDFQHYVTATALDRRPELAPLFDPKLPAGFLARSPKYEETIHELEDRLIVDRKMTVTLADGACSKSSLPKAIAELCFVKNPKNKPDKAVSAELLAIRAKAKANPMRALHGKVRGNQAVMMKDEQLLDLMLNTDDRTIRHVSVVPRQTTKSGSSLGKFGAKLQPAKLAELVPASGGSTSSPTKPNVKPSLGLGTAQRTFDTQYFLTGFTISKQIADTLEYEIAKERWWHRRYYVQVDYHLDAGFGLRAPFSVDVAATGEGDSRNVGVTVKPINVDTNGSPAYAAVGLPKSQTYQGREFVLHLKAGCKLFAQVPAKTFEKSCPSINFDEGRKIPPVLGSDKSNIHTWWIPGSKTGLALTAYGIVTASLDIGIAADLTNGRIGMQASALPSSGMTGLQNGKLSFTNGNPINFTVTRSQNTTNAGFRLEKPTYGFDVRVRPELRGNIEVDVSVYSKKWVIGPYALDFLSISRSFELGHHKNTVAQHDYPVFQTQPLQQAPNAQVLANPDQPSQPSQPTQPTKPTGSGIAPKPTKSLGSTLLK